MCLYWTCYLTWRVYIDSFGLCLVGAFQILRRFPYQYLLLIQLIPWLETNSFHFKRWGWKMSLFWEDVTWQALNKSFTKAECILIGVVDFVICLKGQEPDKNNIKMENSLFDLNATVDGRNPTPPGIYKILQIPINWCKISSINSTRTNKGFPLLFWAIRFHDCCFSMCILIFATDSNWL